MRKMSIGGALFFCLMVFAACGGGQKAENHDYYMYYLDKSVNRIEAEPYVPVGATTEGMLGEFLDQLKQGQSPEYVSPLPEGVEIQRFSLNQGQALIYFNAQYYEMKKPREVLCRAAMVRTIVQIPEIDYVAFYVKDAPLLDAAENPVGMMTADSFVENTGEKMNTISEAELVLYFASEDGTRLVKEVQSVHYSNNQSMEKLILERLMKGPQEQGHAPTIPQDAKLISVSIKDGICYVNFDEAFLNNPNNLSEEIRIYSVVNSMSEISTVNKVQFSINGKSDIRLGETLSLDKLYVRKLDLVESGKEK